MKNVKLCFIINFFNYKDCQIVLFLTGFPESRAFLGFNDVLVFFIEKKSIQR